MYNNDNHGLCGGGGGGVENTHHIHRSTGGARLDQFCHYNHIGKPLILGI
jgi:hypothetical protein